MKTLEMTSIGTVGNTEYDRYLAKLQDRFLRNIAGNPLFTTDAEGLWEAYLSTFGPKPMPGAPAEPLRQYHTCNACEQFVRRYGGLVTIDPEGRARPAIWDADDAPDDIKPAIESMERLVRRAKVTGVFLSSEKVWGTPETGVWRHMAVTPPAEILHTGRLTAGQAMAEKKEDFNTVRRALNEFKLQDLDTAVTLLRTDSLYRSEKVSGQAEWLRDLHATRNLYRATSRENVVWRAVAAAPAGFCHPRSSMIGTLLEDIASGMGYDEVASRFAAKMRPDVYQRPVALPKSGAIEAAEKLVEQMGAAGSLSRRYARLDEVKALWKPVIAPVAPPSGTIFGHLRTKKAPASAMAVPAQTMTWDKFQRTVLPTAERMSLHTPRIGNYTALVTAVNADAPPILQWDSEDFRNPVSWYVWNGGSTPASFSLPASAFVPVDAITLKPSMWIGGFEHQGAGVIFILAGAQETRQAGAALFPEILKSDFHGTRSVIEAYSRSSHLEGMEQPHAAGLMLEKNGGSWRVTVRVWSGNRSLDYCLDRWD